MKPSAASLKQIGIWTAAFERQPASKVREACAELEELGYGAIWFSEGLGREAFTQAALPCCLRERRKSLWPLELRISRDATRSQWRLGKRICTPAHNHARRSVSKYGQAGDRSTEPIFENAPAGSP